MSAATVAVIGGGIAGLAAALRLRDRLGPGARITVYEQGRAIGGKLRTGTLAGVAAEYGADAFLVRDPGGEGESVAVRLARRVGLGDELIHPAKVPPALLLAGQLQPLPAGTLLGVPADPQQVAQVAPVAPGQDRDTGEPVLAAGTDVAVGELVRRRFGDAVVDRLVDPMLGGVYAGRADTLSLAATMPGVATAAATATTLAEAVGAALSAAPRPAGEPVFASVRGGLGRLAAAVAGASGAAVRLGVPVRELTRTGDRWRLVAGATGASELVEADAVVLAVPARPAARLLRELAPAAAELVGELDYASVALVSLALPPATVLPAQAGFLVPATEGLLTKAVTFVTNKWPQRGGGAEPVLVRASVGRYGEAEVLRLADSALVQRVHGELAEVLGGLPAPVASQVQRWGGALPQYRPGHVTRVAAARAALPPGLSLAGAGYDGVGIPACVRSGETAAEQLVAGLEESTV